MESIIPTIEDKPEASKIVDELGAVATSAEDQTTVEEWKAEIDAERAELLGSTPIETQELPDGTFASKEEIEKSQENGEEPSGPYDGGQR